MNKIISVPWNTTSDNWLRKTFVSRPDRLVVQKYSRSSKTMSMHLQGKWNNSTKKKTYAKDDNIEVLVSGKDLKDINALSFAIPYNESSYKFVGIETLNTLKMENLTNNRLHSNREKVLYPTFVNLGNQETIEGSLDLFIIKFKANQKVTFDLKALEGLLVDKNLTL